MSFKLISIFPLREHPVFCPNAPLYIIINLLGMCVFSGMGPVHMNEVECSGFEKSLTDCYFNNDALGCSHEEDAAVRCNIPAMGFQKRVRTLKPSLHILLMF